MAKRLITVAYGDGIGPEITKATLEVLLAAGAEIDIEEVVIGEKLYLSGHPTGIEEKTWEAIRQSKVLLKGPITTPQGGGYRSLNVTIRGKLGLYANVRPCVSYAPFIATKHPQMDLVIIRENEEDLYLGIEYQQSKDACHAIKLISVPGSEKIIRYAFEYAVSHGRKKVTCFSKDNILKLTDGLFHKIFDQIGSQYPQIEKEHWIVDIGSAKVADTPEAFDVIVLPNLYGDILSDIAAQITGSVGIGGSANIGDFGAMFEAVHGSAPKRAGQNLANPSGLLLAGVMLLEHIGQSQIAALVHNAWLKTIEDGIHTYDLFKENVSKKLVGTKEFTKAVVERLGKKPDKLKAIESSTYRKVSTKYLKPQSQNIIQELFGIDVTLLSTDKPESLAKKLKELKNAPFPLVSIYNRGVQVWPEGLVETFCIDQFRCRFLSSTPIFNLSVIDLLRLLTTQGFSIIRTENLYHFDGKKGYS